jgi:hypothetical protein
MIEPIGRGVLDPRMRGDDDHVLGRYLPVVASEAKQSIAQHGDGWIASAFAKASADKSLRSQ